MTTLDKSKLAKDPQRLVVDWEPDMAQAMSIFACYSGRRVNSIVLQRYVAVLVTPTRQIWREEILKCHEHVM